MERLLFFICTISALVITVQITRGNKQSLRQGPEESETTPEGAAGMNTSKKCKMCPRMYKPICASNGKWYRNPCFMACEVGDDSSVNILYQGVCRPEHLSQHPLNITTKIPGESGTMPGGAAGTKKPKICPMCPRMYIPVCASNGKWYNNACFMACEVGDDSSINILYEGICRLEHSSGNPLNVTINTPEEPETTPAVSAEDCRCPKSYNPICASNGQWYQNPCIMACMVGNDSSINIIYEGVCRPEHSSDNPPTVTTEKLFDCHKCDATQFGFHPVCGADGKTYHNECIMQCSNMKAAYVGKCVGPTPGLSSDQHFVANCSSLCPKVYDPVCATNGEWYYNRCIMYCILGIETDVKILYQGKCVYFWRKSDLTSKPS